MKAVSIVSVLGVLGLAAAGTSAGVAANETDRGPALATTQAEGPDADRRAALSDLIGHEQDAGRVLWYDMTANVDYLNTPEKVDNIVAKTAEAGFDTIILDVANNSGFVAYDSAIADHMSQAERYQGQSYPPGYDLLAEVLRAAGDHDLQVHANINAFGLGVQEFAEGPAFDNPEWQTVFYEGRRLASIGAQQYPIAGTNIERGTNQLVVYTPEEYQESPASRWGAEVSVVDGVVVEVRDRHDGDAPPLAVPQDGVVLAGHGEARSWLLDHAQEGAEIDLSATETRLVPAGQSDQQGSTFVNPLRQDVRSYVVSILAELTENYDVDGVVLDRARYANQYADFSGESRQAFEEHIGEPVASWPEDIFEITFTDDGQDITEGPLFADWIEFRASVITDFVSDVSAQIRNLDPMVNFSIYAGAWYPLYWQEGVNWGSRYFQPEYDWASPDYGSTGYAETLDFFMAGTYFEAVTRQEAIEAGQPADWYSVEGSAELAMEAVDLATLVYGSLFVQQYEGDEDQFRDAMTMTMDRTQGLMVFDLVYLEMYDWWHIVEEVIGGEGSSPHTDEDLTSLIRLAAPSADLSDLHTSVQDYTEAGEVAGPIAHQLPAALDQVRQHLDAGRLPPATTALNRAIRHLENPKPSDTLTETAQADLLSQAQSLRDLLR